MPPARRGRVRVRDPGGGGRQLHGRRLQLPARCTGDNAVTPPSNPANANGNPSFWSDKDNANGPLFQTNLKVWEADGSLSCEAAPSEPLRRSEPQ